MLFAGWEVRIGKNCDRGLESAARGRRPRAAFSSPRSQFFTLRTDPKPVNNLFIFSKLSGDIQLNPGPTQLPFALLTQRLRTIDLRPLDVDGDGDGDGDVSHQLCGTPDYHFAIRDAGIQYLRDHPEEFIESAMLQIIKYYVLARNMV